MLKKTLFVSSVVTSNIGIYFYKKTQLPVDKRFNIVFDLDETLVATLNNKTYEDYNHSKITCPDFVMTLNENKKICVWKRPYSSIVLPFLASFNNLHLLTRGTKQYAEKIIDIAEYDKYFQTKKFRHEIKSKQKCLSLINSNVDRCMLIDDKLSNKQTDQKFYHIAPYSFSQWTDIELLKLSAFIIKETISDDIKELVKQIHMNKK